MVVAVGNLNKLRCFRRSRTYLRLNTDTNTEDDPLTGKAAPAASKL